MKKIWLILPMFLSSISYAQTVSNPFGNSSDVSITTSNKTANMPQIIQSPSLHKNNINNDTQTCNNVWINKNTHIYHTQNDKWYGKTKNGIYMCEEQAISDGFRKAKRS
jgi:hypothetical protein